MRFHATDLVSMQNRLLLYSAQTTARYEYLNLFLQYIYSNIKIRNKNYKTCQKTIKVRSYWIPLPP